MAELSQITVDADGIPDAGGSDTVPTLKPLSDALVPLVKAEDAAHSSGDVGIQMLAVRKDTSNTGLGANGDYTPLAVDSSGRLYVTAPLLDALIGVAGLKVYLDPSTVNANGRADADDCSPTVLSTEDLAAIQGNLSVFRSLDLDETEEEVKATAGRLYKLRLTNFATSPRYVKLYNATADNVTVGTTTPIDTIVLPAAESGDCVVVTENFGGKGLTFSTALSIACTTGLADNNSGAPSANDVVVSAYYE